MQRNNLGGRDQLFKRHAAHAKSLLDVAGSGDQVVVQNVDFKPGQNFGQTTTDGAKTDDADGLAMDVLIDPPGGFLIPMAVSDPGIEDNQPAAGGEDHHRRVLGDLYCVAGA